MILNYKPKIEHQHIHMGNQTVDDVEDVEFVEEKGGNDNSEKGAANDIIFPQSSFDNIFHRALNINKVKVGINRIIIAKGKEGKFQLSVKWWFVVHKVLEEIDWLNDKQNTKFIQWIDDVYGWEWKTRDFKSVLAGFKHTHSTKWNEDTVKDANTGREYRDFANYVRSQFVDIDANGEITDKQEFLKLGSDGKPMYIGHDLKIKL
jgi:hypothetical protein